eukprot:CAMPEP_0175047692 /NCGR_PEP_ID=MMETSP0052_2-20121109/5748_1 /TAXON_ID=51329 ORGANISM="Polytomella parva, Strain SAG 63-3" /NCGR_SAMPLE_ID=MMETSP0052_2 /ASSEMBLY_ACC=CAM_ASM_000194 /LENGTH=586 /DNA_ID=CAMNT_0016311619 /DNA_START=110 /DNA_END=1867 /DNA_ORIENTATION=-
MNYLEDTTSAVIADVDLPKLLGRPRHIVWCPVSNLIAIAVSSSPSSDPKLPLSPNPGVGLSDCSIIRNNSLHRLSAGSIDASSTSVERSDETRIETRDASTAPQELPPHSIYLMDPKDPSDLTLLLVPRDTSSSLQHEEIQSLEWSHPGQSRALMVGTTTGVIHVYTQIPDAATNDSCTNQYGGSNFVNVQGAESRGGQSPFLPSFTPRSPREWYGTVALRLPEPLAIASFLSPNRGYGWDTDYLLNKIRYLSPFAMANPEIAMENNANDATAIGTNNVSENNDSNANDSNIASSNDTDRNDHGDNGVGQNAPDAAGGGPMTSDPVLGDAPNAKSSPTDPLMGSSLPTTSTSRADPSYSAMPLPSTSFPPLLLGSPEGPNDWETDQCEKLMGALAHESIQSAFLDLDSVRKGPSHWIRSHQLTVAAMTKRGALHFAWFETKPRIGRVEGRRDERRGEWKTGFPINLEKLIFPPAAEHEVGREGGEEGGRASEGEALDRMEPTKQAEGVFSQDLNALTCGCDGYVSDRGMSDEKGVTQGDGNGNEVVGVSFVASAGGDTYIAVLDSTQHETVQILRVYGDPRAYAWL